MENSMLSAIISLFFYDMRGGTRSTTHNHTWLDSAQKHITGFLDRVFSALLCGNPSPCHINCEWQWNLSMHLVVSIGELRTGAPWRLDTGRTWVQCKQPICAEEVERGPLGGAKSPRRYMERCQFCGSTDKPARESIRKPVWAARTRMLGGRSSVVLGIFVEAAFAQCGHNSISFKGATLWAKGNQLPPVV